MRIQIRKRNLELTPELASHVDRRLRFSLGRFAGRLRSAVVNLEDVNGPRGGVDQECKLTIQTNWHSQIVIEERDADMFVAVTRAADRAGRAVGRQTSLRYGAGIPRPVKVRLGNSGDQS